MDINYRISNGEFTKIILVASCGEPTQLEWVVPKSSCRISGESERQRCSMAYPLPSWISVGIHTDAARRCRRSIIFYQAYQHITMTTRINR